jgi:UDP-N-acetylmuramate-alanine ligase
MIHSFEGVVRVVESEARPGDLIITMGAGDVTLLSGRLVEALRA